MRSTATLISRTILATACLAASAAPAAECLLPVEGGDVARRITDIRPEGETPRLVGAENGLFELDGDRLVRNNDDGLEHDITVIRPEGETPRFIGSAISILYFEEDRLVYLDGSHIANWASIIRPPGETPRLVGADNGLFWLNGERLFLVEGGGIVGSVSVIGPPDETPRFVGGGNGLFQLDGERLVPVEGSDLAGSITVIRPEGETPRFVGALFGLFRLDGERLFPVEGGDVAGPIHGIRPEVETPRLVVTESGLFQLNKERLVRVEGSEVATAIDVILPPDEERRLVGAYNGLFRFDGDRLVPVEGGHIAEGITVIRPEGETPRLVGAENGLFQYWWMPNPQVVEGPGTISLLRSSAHSLRWKVSDACIAAELAKDRLAVRIEDMEGHFPANTFQLGDSDLPGTVGVVATVPVEAEDGGTLIAWLQYRDREDEPWRDLEGSRTVLNVNWGAIDHAMDWLSRFGGWAVAGHAVLFALLLVAARRSARAWKILADPVLNKSFLWFWFAMRHVPVLQRWLLSRWFDGRKQMVDAAPHVPLPLSGPGKSVPSTADLADEVRPGRRLWVQGNTGMGKTALFDHLVARYFDDPDEPRPPAWTLARAFRKYGYVAIPVALREHATLPVPAAPEDWIFEVVGRELARSRLAIADCQLLKGIVTSGRMVLVLDGANEVEDGGAILQFALRYPEVGLLVTSQTLPDADAARLFEVWRLPGSIESAVAPLLAAWLGDKRGREVTEAIAASPMREDIHSGYDVRLLADLVEGGTAPEALPEMRMGLYEAMLARAERADGSAYPLPELCRVAWSTWSTGRRRLAAGDDVPETLLAPLRAEGVRILRPVDGGSFEFRHDQMRGYLAARWAAVHEVSPVHLFEEPKGIWRLGRSEQQVVWGFFAELIGRERGPEVLDWATLHAERAELQVALRGVARRDHWPTPEAMQASANSS